MEAGWRWSVVGQHRKAVTPCKTAPDNWRVHQSVPVVAIMSAALATVMAIGSARLAPKPFPLCQHDGYVALLQRSRLSVAVVSQIIGVPLVVTPRAPASAQNAPGCTIGMLPLLGLSAGEEGGTVPVGWGSVGELRYVW